MPWQRHLRESRNKFLKGRIAPDRIEQLLPGDVGRDYAETIGHRDHRPCIVLDQPVDGKGGPNGSLGKLAISDGVEVSTVDDRRAGGIAGGFLPSIRAWR